MPIKDDLLLIRKAFLIERKTVIYFCLFLICSYIAATFNEIAPKAVFIAIGLSSYSFCTFYWGYEIGRLEKQRGILENAEN